MADLWSVEDLGQGTHVFRWRPGFYASVFAVTGSGVVATDPIDETAAASYREAIASVTSQPVRWILYSHDHRDHITGARALAPDAEVIAHHSVGPWLATRGDRDIVAPTRHLDDDETLEFGQYSIELHHYGPNHSRTNSAFIFPAATGPMLLFVDLVEPGVAPYRELPDTDIIGSIRSLRAASKLDCQTVMGGHRGPGDPAWVTGYLAYFEELVERTEAAFRRGGGQNPLPGEDGIAMTERFRDEVCRAVTEELRPGYGSWHGFDAWVPKNVDRVLGYVITGN